MFRVAICDDQSDQLKTEIRIAEKYFEEAPGLDAVITGYDDPDAFLSDLRSSGGWDIVILDVCMPGYLGTDIAKEIRDRHDRTEIIFVSFSRDYAVEAFSLNAVHYVTKPLSEESVREALDRAVRPFAERAKKPVMLSLENGVIQNVDANDIMYIESVAYRRIVHTATADYEETKKPLSKLFIELEALCPGQFIQPNRGYIVNLDSVRTISADRIIMQNGDSILIRRGDFRNLRDIFFQWSFREQEA